MAETNFQPKSKIRVFIADEVGTLGATLSGATGEVWNEYPVMDYSIPFPGPTVEQAPTRAGMYIPTDTSTVARLDTQMYPFDLTIKGTTNAVLKALLFAIGDGSSPAVLAGDYAPPSYKDGIDNGVDNSHFSVLFQDAGSDATNVDLYCKGCVVTGITLSQDIGSDAGILKLVMNCVTAYLPTETAITPLTPTLDTGTPHNIRDLDFATSGITGAALETFLMTGWELGLTRTIERVSYKDTTNYDPYGYVMNGGWELSGSMTVKRDNSINDLLSKMKDSGGSNAVQVDIKESTAANFTLTVAKATLDLSSIDSGGNILYQTIPFKPVATASSESSNVISLTIAN